MDKMEIIMCPPKYMSSDIANNDWMKEYEGDIAVNTDIAYKQYFDLYHVWKIRRDFRWVKLFIIRKWFWIIKGTIKRKNAIKE